MLKKVSLIAAALAVMACLGAGSASAATLYTTGAHTTSVPVGTKFTASLPGGKYWESFNSSGALFNVCESANLSFAVAQNSAGVFRATLTNVGLASCLPSAYTGSVTGDKELKVSGTPLSVENKSDWASTTLRGVGWSMQGCLCSWVSNFSSAVGNPPGKGAFMSQPSGTKSPVSIVLDRAPEVTGDFIGKVGTVSSVYTFTGAASGWSLG